MLYEYDLITIEPRIASVILGAILGVAFGVLAQKTRFCLRRSVIAGPDQKAALGVWLTALATAIIGVQTLVYAGLNNLENHRFLQSDLPVLAIVIGGLAFGAGMVLTRGCVSRLTVLSATGNLRAAFVITIFAIVAHATLKGILSPFRTGLGSVTVDLGDSVSLAALPGDTVFWAMALSVMLAGFAITTGAKRGQLVLAALIGFLVPAGWVGTGFFLYDDFDPIALQSLSFTSPWSDTLFWTIASTAIPAGFGTGLIGGVLLGSFVAAMASREFNLVSFESPKQTLSYAAGAVLMGFGGVLAGGCTVGAGLSGVPTLSYAAILALISIVTGAAALDAFLRKNSVRVSQFGTPAE